MIHSLYMIYPLCFGQCYGWNNLSPSQLNPIFMINDNSPESVIAMGTVDLLAYVVTILCGGNCSSGTSVSRA